MPAIDQLESRRQPHRCAICAVDHDARHPDGIGGMHRKAIQANDRPHSAQPVEKLIQGTSDKINSSPESGAEILQYLLALVGRAENRDRIAPAPQ